MRSQATTLLTLVGSASAFWRMPCRSQTGVGRLDPLMDPGEVADHVHTIHGGGGFGFNTDFDTLTANDSCTSCGVLQDHSAYWTPSLHFIYSNGTSVMVQQVGGMLAYYLYYLSNVTAFPEGFQMLAGNKNLREFTGPVPDIELSYWPTDPTDQFFLEQRSLGFNCLNYAKDPEPSLYRHTLPSREYLDANCTDGIRLELAFPSCGTGALDSEDHKSHMAYPSLVKEGNCPEGYDTHYPFMFFETIWATNAFVGEDGQFVLSHGDPTGCGYHGDFIMGWESANFLQNALDTCQSSSGQIQDCSLFTLQSDEDAAQCSFPMPDVLKEDDAKGPREGLPVGVPIQYGPENATAYPVAGRSGVATSAVPTSSISSYTNAPTLAYSAANPSETSTAQGGIVVHKASVTPSTTGTSSTSTITAAPSLESASDDGADAIATSWMTNGNEVVELVIEEVDITVTATAAPTPGSNYKRHLHKHLHGHGSPR